MLIRIDRRLIEILCSLGVSITFEQFRHAYNLRRLERECRGGK